MIHTGIKKSLLIIMITYITGAMIISPHTATNAAKGALELCSNTVIPSLFPFIFCSNMLIALGIAEYANRYFSVIMQPVFGISGDGAAALILGMISGYPVGGVCAAELYNTGRCTKNEAERLTAFCNNSGPMFVIGAVGTQIFGNYKIGVILYIIHIFSGLISGMILKIVKKNYPKNNLSLPKGEDTDIKTTAVDIGTAVVKSVDTILMICGFVVIFAVITTILPDTKINPYLYGILEITGGIPQIAKALPIDSALVFTAGAISFSGISVLSQVITITDKAGLSIKPYLIGKTIQGVISAFMMWLVIVLNNGVIPTAYLSNINDIGYINLNPNVLFLNSCVLLSIAITLGIILTIINKIIKRSIKFDI